MRPGAPRSGGAGPVDAEGEPAASAGADHRLPRAARITTTAEIRGLFRRGKRRRTRHLDVIFAASPGAFPRLGVVVPKHRKTAVRRNRLKRRLRELGRSRLLPRLREANLALDVLLRARPEAYAAAFAELRAELDRFADEVCSRGR